MHAWLRGWRSDRYGAVLELAVAACIGAVGAYGLWSAAESCSLALATPEPYSVPDSKYCFKELFYAAVHFLPAPAIALAALIFQRRDPHTRLLIAAWSALAIGSANVVAVMQFIAAPLALVGAVAIAAALRPNTLWAVLAAIASAASFDYAAIRLNMALYPPLRAWPQEHERWIRRGGFEPALIDTGDLARSALAVIIAAGLLVAALALRRTPAEPHVRKRACAVSILALIVSGGVYVLLSRFGLPLDA